MGNPRSPLSPRGLEPADSHLDAIRLLITLFRLDREAYLPLHEQLLFDTLAVLLVLEDEEYGLPTRPEVVAWRRASGLWPGLQPYDSAHNRVVRP